jgi:predicted DCC family thiol-disulfide oxidoreductase YuxK
MSRANRPGADAMPSDPAPGRGICLFDGECPFCRKSMRILQKLDWFGRVHYQNCRDVANLPPSSVPLDPEQMLVEMHLLPPSRDRVYAGFKAVRWILWRLPLTAVFTPLLYLPGVPWIGQKVYLKIAANRFKLVPCDETGACRVPLNKSAKSI